MTKARSVTADAFGAFSAETSSMMAEVIAKRSQRKQTEQREFQIVLGAFFALFLVIALASRVLPRAWRPLDRGGLRARSVIGEAKAAANEIVPFLFMR